MNTFGKVMLVVSISAVVIGGGIYIYKRTVYQGYITDRDKAQLQSITFEAK